MGGEAAVIIFGWKSVPCWSVFLSQKMSLAAYSVEEVSSFLLKKGFPSDLVGNLAGKSINIDAILTVC